MVLQVWKDRYVTKEIWPVGGPPSTTLDIEIQREWSRVQIRRRDEDGRDCH
jgi:hypothetical protein